MVDEATGGSDRAPRRGVSIRVPGLDRRVTASGPGSCEERTMTLWEPTMELAVAVMQLFGGTPVTIGEMKEKRTSDRWPRGLHRSVQLSTPAGSPIGVVNLGYTHYNPRDGDGWNLSIELYQVDARPSISAGSWCGHTHRLRISGHDLEPAQIDALKAAAIGAFDAPHEVVRRSPPSSSET
jgi:hypothetical protein